MTEVHPYTPETILNFHEFAEKLPEDFLDGIASAPRVSIQTEFSVESWNSLIHIHDTGRNVQMIKAKVYTLGSIILKYNMENDVGIWLAHKHFDLLPNEKIVSTVAPSKSAAHELVLDVTPRTVIANAAHESHPHAEDAPIISSTCPLIPHLFKLSNSGVWSPMQFLSSTAETTGVSDRAMKLMGAQEFLQEYAAALRCMGVQNELGLSLKIDDAIGSDSTMGTLETTDATPGAERRQTISLLEEGESAKEIRSATCWRFTKGPDGQIKMDACSCKQQCDWNRWHCH